MVGSVVTDDDSRASVGRELADWAGVADCDDPRITQCCIQATAPSRTSAHDVRNICKEHEDTSNKGMMC